MLCLGPDGWGEAVAANRTIDQVFRPFVENIGKPNDQIISRSLTKQLQPYDQLHLVAASLFLDDLEILLTASHQGDAIRSEWNKRTLICRWIHENNVDDMYDYIIFDCPPATKIVTQNAIAASDCYIVPVVPEAVMERGTPHLYDVIRTRIDSKLKDLSSALRESSPIHVHDTQLAGVVVTRIRTSGSYSGYVNDHTQHLRTLMERWKDDLVQPYIHDGVGVSDALAEGVPVYDRSKTQNVGRRQINTQYSDLVRALKMRIDSR